MELKKSMSADLEQLRGIYLQTGLLVSLALVYVALEWSARKSIFVVSQSNGHEYTWEDELPPVVRFVEQVKKKSTRIVIGEPTKEKEQKVAEKPMEKDKTIPVLIVEPEPDKIPEPTVFTIVEKMPEFPGGERALFEWIHKNLRYPEMAREIGIQGTVFLSFVVGHDGKIRDIELLAGVRGLNEEAIRVAKAMPDWIPGRQRDQPVAVRYNLPLKFTLKQ